MVLKIAKFWGYNYLFMSKGRYIFIITWLEIILGIRTSWSTYCLWTGGADSGSELRSQTHDSGRTWRWRTRHSRVNGGADLAKKVEAFVNASTGAFAEALPGMHHFYKYVLVVHTLVLVIHKFSLWYHSRSSLMYFFHNKFNPYTQYPL